VLLLTDDQRFDQLAHMPVVHSQLIDRGVQFRALQLASASDATAG
jgi:hypothetical protein